jgi:hypothetical protein
MMNPSIPEASLMANTCSPFVRDSLGVGNFAGLGARLSVSDVGVAVWLDAERRGL